MITHIKVSIKPISRHFPEDGGISEQQFKEIAAIFPELAKNDQRIIYSCIGEYDPKFLEIIRVLETNGIELPSRFQRNPPIFVYKYKEFSLDEIDAAEYLEPNSLGPQLLECERLESRIEQRWGLRSVTSRKKAIGHLWGYANHLVAPVDVAESFASHGIKGISLRKFEPGKISDGIEDFRYIWTNVELPVVQNKLFDNLGNVFASADQVGEMPNGCFLLDGDFTTPQLIYNRADIQAMEPFDIAHTFERFENHEPRLRRIIVSQHFRRVCTEMGARMNWFPVCLIDS